MTSTPCSPPSTPALTPTSTSRRRAGRRRSSRTSASARRTCSGMPTPGSRWRSPTARSSDTSASSRPRARDRRSAGRLARPPGDARRGPSLAAVRAPGLVGNRSRGDPAHGRRRRDVRPGLRAGPALYARGPHQGVPFLRTPGMAAGRTRQRPGAGPGAGRVPASSSADQRAAGHLAGLLEPEQGEGRGGDVGEDAAVGELEAGRR